MKFAEGGDPVIEAASAGRRPFGRYRQLQKTRRRTMEKKLIILAMAAGAMLGAYGKTFSLDLRSAGNGGARPRLAATAQPRDDGTLRAFDLDAGVADVGAVAVGDELTFTLFDDVALTLTLKEKMPSPLGGDAFLAEIAGYDGIKSAVVLRTSDGLTIDVQDFRSRKCYKVLSSHDGVKVRELEAKAGMCGGDSLRPSASADVKPSPRLQSSPSGQGDSCVDILVAYDKNAAAWAKSQGGGLTNFAQTAVQKMNYALSNTGLAEKFQFRLVGVVAVSASTNSLPAALNAATYGFSGWERIVARRDEVGADIVTVLIDTGSAYGTTGMGWSLRDEEYEWFSDYACNVCSIRAVAVSHTMTHEVGHNMGCGHSDIQESDPGPQLFAYSAGYYFTGNDGENYCTIMAYETEGPGGEQIFLNCALPPGRSQLKRKTSLLPWASSSAWSGRRAEAVRGRTIKQAFGLTPGIRSKMPIFGAASSGRSATTCQIIQIGITQLLTWG